MPSTILRRIASHYLLTPQGFYSCPLITVDSTNRQTVKIEKYDNSLDFKEGVEFYSGIICQGFVNAHCHSELSYLHGAIPTQCGYASFASEMAAVRNNYTEQQRLAAIMQADSCMWQEGIDAVADIVNDNSSFAVKQQSAIFYHSFAEVFGLKKSNIELCNSLVNNPNTTLTPHSVYSVQESDFKSVCRSGDYPLSIHFKESEGEELLFKGEGPLAEWYSKVGFQCDFLHHKSPSRRIVDSIPAQRSVMLVHNCHITQEDIDTIMGHFTAPVYWVLCPRSNRYISGKITEAVNLLRKNNLTICIGTDSLASNHSLSILEELKCFDSIPLEELLRWATTNGAKALDFHPKGLINISGVDLKNMKLTSDSQIKRVL